MRFMIIRKADKNTEAGVMPSQELLTAIQVRSLDQAIAWVTRWPVEDGYVELEIRQVLESDDFGEALSPELREQEARMRAEAAKKA